MHQMVHKNFSQILLMNQNLLDGKSYDLKERRAFQHIPIQYHIFTIFGRFILH